MPKQKSSAQIHVADGAGGMRQVADFRFEAGEWPIELVVLGKDAETWMAHLSAETEERGWNSSSISQLDASENSGTLSVHTANGPSPATVDIVWERPRGKELRVRARPSWHPVLSLDVARDFINAVGERVRIGKVLRAHRLALLTYDGLPWRGELWLDDNLRLGPPSKHPDTLLGPQILIVDAMMEGIGQQGVTANFQKRLYEIRVFLGFVLGLRIEMSKFEQAWAYDIDAEGRFTDCKLRNVGYVELSPQVGFPKLGCAPPVERRNVRRPGLGPYGITHDMHEKWVPGDIEQLWRSFLELPPPKRDHLLRAGNAFLTALLMWPEQRTAYAAFLVVACESLKPTGKAGDLMNVYDVVASLMSPNEAQGLRQLSFHPQQVRSKHLHRGELVEVPLELYISRRAAREIERVVQWWASNRPAAPGAIRQDLHAALNLLLTQPDIGVRVPEASSPDVRRFHLDRIRYWVYYPRPTRSPRSLIGVAFKPRQRPICLIE